MELEAIGVAGQMRLTDDTLIISRRGLLGLLTQGLKGDKEIRLDQISSVQFKDAGFTNGYLQVGFMGGFESKAGIMDAVSDENTVMFNRAQQESFEIMRDAIHERIKALRAHPAPQQAVSASDEIRKFASLRDDGLISDAEFEAKKKQILGL